MTEVFNLKKALQPFDGMTFSYQELKTEVNNIYRDNFWALPSHSEMEDLLRIVVKYYTSVETVKLSNQYTINIPKGDIF